MLLFLEKIKYAYLDQLWIFLTTAAESNGFLIVFKGVVGNMCMYFGNPTRTMFK